MGQENRWTENDAGPAATAALLPRGSVLGPHSGSAVWLAKLLSAARTSGGKGLWLVGAPDGSDAAAGALALDRAWCAFALAWEGGGFGLAARDRPQADRAATHPSAAPTLASGERP